MGSCSSKKSKKQPKNEVTTQKVDLQQQSIRKTQRATSMIPILTKTAQTDTVNESMISKCSTIKMAEKLKKMNVIRQGLFRTYTIVGLRYESQTETLEDRQIKIIQHNVSGAKKRMEIISKRGNKVESLIGRLQKNTMNNEYISQISEIYQDDSNYYLLQDYCSGGSLDKLNLNDAQVEVLLTQMLTAISYIHQKKMVHGNLTSQSFHLLNSQNSLFCKLVDVSCLYEHATGVRIEPNKIDFAQDVYAIGAIAYELLTGQKPFVVKQKQKEQAEQILLFKDGTSNSLKELLKRMLNTNVFERITIEEAKKKLQNKNKLHSQTLTEPLLHLSKCKKRNYFHQSILIFMANKFVKEEYEVLNKIFIAADINQDGLLDRIELTKLFQQVIQLNNNADINSIIEVLDVNNQAIDQQQFIIGALNLDELLTSTYLEACFKYLQNKNGYITVSSLRKHLEVDEDQIREAIEESTGNRKLDYQEFAKLMTQLL